MKLKFLSHSLILSNHQGSLFGQNNNNKYLYSTSKLNSGLNFRATSILQCDMM